MEVKPPRGWYACSSLWILMAEEYQTFRTKLFVLVAGEEELQVYVQKRTH